MNRPTQCIALVSALCALLACSRGTSALGNGGTSPSTASAASGSTGGSNWIANATTACEKYLTPDVVATIWDHPEGQSKPFDTRSAGARACVYQSAHSGKNITITLNTDGPENFDGGRKYFVEPAPLPNVGDKASLTGDGIVAVKGNDRTCHIDAYGNVGDIKLSREALGQKFGEICDQLFALP
jgi:hypothetical protein